MPDPFDVDGLDEIKALVDRYVSVEFMEAGRHAMELTLKFLQGEIPEYPAQAHRKADTANWTDKQRRYFFWALNEGIIQVPYRRTGTLVRKITNEVKSVGAVIEGHIGIDADYAPWVVGPDRNAAITIGGVKKYQSRGHSGVWWQFLDVVEDNLDEAFQVFVTEFYEYLGKVT